MLDTADPAAANGSKSGFGFVFNKRLDIISSLTYNQSYLRLQAVLDALEYSQGYAPPHGLINIAWYYYTPKCSEMSRKLSTVNQPYYNI